MRKTLKLLKLLAVITLCLSFYSCTDSSSYYESTSVTRTGGESGSTAKKPAAVYSAPVPDTVVVQDLKALGSVRDLMQPK